MRTEGQVRQQLKQVMFRHLQRRLRDNFRQTPSGCAHNIQIILDTTQDVAICGFLSPDGTPRGVVCDDRHPTCLSIAKDCPLWAPLRDKASVKEAFYALMKSADRGEIAAEYPDIAALMWVLDTPSIPSEEEVEAIEHQPDSVGWWGTLKKKLGGTP